LHANKTTKIAINVPEHAVTSQNEVLNFVPELVDLLEIWILSQCFLIRTHILFY